MIIDLTPEAGSGCVPKVAPTDCLPRGGVTEEDPYRVLEAADKGTRYRKLATGNFPAAALAAGHLPAAALATEHFPAAALATKTEHVNASSTFTLAQRSVLPGEAKLKSSARPRSGPSTCTDEPSDKRDC